MVLWWGRSAYTQFYNDAYISFLGKEKHPAFLGRSGRDCWSEIWPTIGPMLEGVYTSGTATWSEDLLLILQRKLPREEGYFTFSYSPIRDDDGAVAGIFCACNETTSRVLGERRLRTLRDLSRMEAAARTVETTCEIAARTLGENPNDIPFALIYLLNSDTGQAELVGSHAIRAGDSAAPLKIDLNSTIENRSGWPLRAALDTGAHRLVEDLSKRFGSLPGDPWPEPSENALIVPIAAPGQTAAAGFLVSGLSPRRVVDNNYTSFLKLVAGHIGTSVANARAYDLERKRAETLMEIDRAKTLFFSNVSHEFRTPHRLQEVANQCMRAGDHFQECLDAILETAIEISGADKGNIQLFDAGSNCLKIASQKGFQKPFLSFFSEVRADEGSASGHVLRSDKRVIVEDVTQSVIFAGQPSLDVLLKAEVRALQVTPLISSAGKTLGMLSTHFSKSFRPGERELRFIDLLARLAADFLERKHSEQIHQTILRELQHRSNNLLAVIQSIAHRSLAGDKGKEAFEARLQALARANRALLNSNWSGVELDQLVREELEAFSKQASIAGPAIVLQPQVAQNFTLGLHELATNAAKHGALSTRAGKIAVGWALQPSPSGSVLKFKWQETAAPPWPRLYDSASVPSSLKPFFRKRDWNTLLRGLGVKLMFHSEARESKRLRSQRDRPPAANDAAAISGLSPGEATRRVS